MNILGMMRGPLSGRGVPRPIGSPPPEMNHDAKVAWADIVAAAAPDSLRFEHRHTVEIGARLLANSRIMGMQMPADRERTLLDVLERLGMTPRSLRGRIR